MYKDVDSISKKTFLRKKEEIQKEAQKRFLSRFGKEDNLLSSKHIDEDKMVARKLFIDNKDSIAMERILGNNDLVPIAYLLEGYTVGNSVCRITLVDRVGNIVGSGTGFLVAPGLVMTNNHVLPNIDFANNSFAEFNYQNDENFIAQPVYKFKLDPETFFITDEKLDFTIVAVKEEKYNDKTVFDFGKIQLLGSEEKIFEGEYVSIIQHPNGGPKSVTLRENQVSSIFDDYVHYMTDTEPGSSGSPVFNDQWLVVALHHAGVPDPNDKDSWVANEGIRISSIFKSIKEKYSHMNDSEKTIIKNAFPKMFDKKEETEGLAKGYDSNFLGEKYKVELPKLSKDMKDDVTRMDNGEYVLDYTHFSIVMCKSRGLAYFTGVNIDGSNKVNIKRGGDKWKFDDRISEEFQYGNDVYKLNKLDRGHLVKRTDPNWGRDAHQANDDTFHYTNSAPQHKNLNQKIWLNLEDYILNNAHNHNLKVSVFTGPVFKDDDKVYRNNYKIPKDFWKVVVMVKDNEEISATAYLQTQENMLDDLEFVYGAFKTYQVPVRQIEKLTGLDFGELSEHDPIANVEFSGLLISDENSIRL